MTRIEAAAALAELEAELPDDEALEEWRREAEAALAELEAELFKHLSTLPTE